MDKEYLIIYEINGDTRYYFLDTEKELLENIKVCQRLKFNVIFAGKIQVVKEYIG
jgi:hypothetical protein